MEESGFNLEMPKVGIIKGVLAKDIEVVGTKVVNLRTGTRPYSNVYTVNQLRTLKNVLEKYGSDKVHLSPRHNMEIPEVKMKDLDVALKELYISGLFPGGAGTSVRNIFTCPQWCKYAVRQVGEIGKMVSANFGDRDMPNKFTISFAGCTNGCSRPHNTDMGIIAVARIAVSDKTCPADCTECTKVCRTNSIAKTGSSVKIDQTCFGCGSCPGACKYGVLSVKETGYRILIGGKEGSTVAFGQQYADFVQDFDVLDTIERTIAAYKRHAIVRPKGKKKMERMSETIERLGLKNFMS